MRCATCGAAARAMTRSRQRSISIAVSSSTASRRATGTSRSRRSLEELWLEATRALAQSSVESGRDHEAAAALRRLVEHDPVDEEASRALMACALRRGERGEALREYRRLERALQDELGVEPGPETAAVYKQIRRGGEV